jgi:hypothetical protein
VPAGRIRLSTPALEWVLAIGIEEHGNYSTYDRWPNVWNVEGTRGTHIPEVLEFASECETSLHNTCAVAIRETLNKVGARDGLTAEA